MREGGAASGKSEREPLHPAMGRGKGFAEVYVERRGRGREMGSFSQSTHSSWSPLDALAGRRFPLGIESASGMEHGPCRLLLKAQEELGGVSLLVLPGQHGHVQVLYVCVWVCVCVCACDMTL